MATILINNEDRKSLEKAIGHVDRGNAILKRWSIIDFCCGSNKVEDAVENFSNAANIYVQLKRAREASFMFTKCGELIYPINSHDAVGFYKKAANMMKSDKPYQIDALKKVIVCYTDSGDFYNAAMTYQLIAEIYEDNHDMRLAVDHYELSAEHFENSSSVSKLNVAKVLLKAADIHVILENYGRAIEIYEEVAKIRPKFSARDILFKSGLCYLMMQDYVGGKRALDLYNVIEPSFDILVEGKLLRNIIEALTANNEEAFMQACHEYNNIKQFDRQIIYFLDRIKEGAFGGDMIDLDDMT